jgi:hypothetical protein
MPKDTDMTKAVRSSNMFIPISLMKTRPFPFIVRIESDGQHRA